MSCPFAQQSRSSRSSAQSASVSRGTAARSAYQRSASAAAPQQWNSQVEQAVIGAQQPLPSNEREQVQAGSYRGIQLNRQEEQQFQGPVPLSQYKINEDPNPEVIRKRLDRLRYQQEVAVKYLQPPSPPRPGDLIIKERQGQVPPAPPVVLRQEAENPVTPTPLVLREQPPRRPPCVPQQVVEVEGAPVPPPARRVVLEKLTSLPPKPQNVVIEKWLPYKQQRRRVVFQRSCAQAPPNPKNLIIEWEAPDVEVEKVCKDLGVERADPEEYIRRYGPELRQPGEIENPCGCAPPRLPSPPRAPTPPPPQQCCPQPRPRTPTPAPQCGCPAPAPAPRTPTPPPPPPPQPSCGQPACGAQPSRAAGTPELTGDVAALRLIDNLSRHGLGSYRRYVQ